MVLGGASALIAASSSRAELIGTTVGSARRVHPGADVATHRVYLLFDDNRDQLLAVNGDADVSALRFETARDGARLEQSCAHGRNTCVCDLPGDCDAGGDSWFNIGSTIGDTQLSAEFCPSCPNRGCVAGSFFERLNNTGYYDAHPETPERPDAEGRILIAQFSLPVGTCFSYMATATYRDPDTGDLVSQAFDVELCPCRPDVDGSGIVDTADLLRVLSDWGRGGNCPPYYRADVDRSCRVDMSDLLLILGAWGPCPSSAGEGV